MELQVDVRNLTMRTAWQEKIDEEKAKLIRHHPGLIQHLRVTIEGTRSHKEGGCELLIVATVPNDTVVVKRKGDRVIALLGDAFNTLGMQLKEMQRKRRQTAKIQEGIPYDNLVGIVDKLFLDESYGFILTADGRDVYFHENSLKDISIGELAIGDEVLFAQAEGEKGPCAAWVKAAKNSQ
jgi:cold shock CspA family protein/ribosome-associated translation inhibitor RaiA